MRVNSLSNILIPIKRRKLLINEDVISLSNVARALDPLLLAFSIIRGLYWTRYGVEFFREEDYEAGKVRLNDLCRDKPDECILEVASRLYEHGLLLPLPGDPSPAVDKYTVKPYYDFMSNYNSNLIDISEEELASYNTLVTIESYISSHFTDATMEWMYRVASKIAQYFSKITGFEKVFFKTIHGELLRQIANAGPLPLHVAVANVNVLPVLIDIPAGSLIRGDKSHMRSIEDLKDSLIQYFIKVHGVNEELAPCVSNILIGALKSTGIVSLDIYQFQVISDFLDRSASKGSDVPVVLTAPTGAGKTIIFSIILLARRLGYRFSSRYASDVSNKTMIIYPRKTLATQQLQRLARLVYHVNKLIEGNPCGVLVDPITIAIRDQESLARWSADDSTAWDSIRGICFEEATCARHRVVNGEYHSEPEWLFDVKEKFKIKGRNMKALEAADIIVTNYAMAFKMALRYLDTLIGGAPPDPLHIAFSRTDQVFLDEAHIYLEEDYAPLISTVVSLLNYQRSVVSNVGKLGLVISSATLSNFELIPRDLSTKNIVGVVKTTGAEPSRLKDILRAITGGKIDLDNIVMRDYNETISEKLRKEVWKYPMKISLWAVVSTMPDRRSSTALQESLVNLLHVINSLRLRTGNTIRFMGLTFIDKKEQLLRIIDWFTNRIILEAGDHYDRVLLTSKKYNVNIDLRRSSDSGWLANIMITNEIEKRLGNGNSLASVIWDLDPQRNVSIQLSHFHAIAPYLDADGYKNLRSAGSTNWVDILDKIVNKNNILHEIDKFANIVKEYHIFRDDYKLKELLDKLDRENLKLYYTAHHGDIRVTRPLIDKKIVEGEPLLVLSTSTLEVGLDIPGVIAVIQYSQDAPIGSPTQRLGRSGRSAESLFISNGILILKNTKEDIRLIEERNAIDYLFTMYFDVPRPLSDNPVFIASIINTVLMRAALRDLNGKYTQGILEVFINKLQEKFSSKYNKIQEITKSLATEHGAVIQYVRYWIHDVVNVIEAYLSQFRDDVNIGKIKAEDYLRGILTRNSGSFFEKYWIEDAENRYRDYGFTLDKARGPVNTDLDKLIRAIIRALRKKLDNSQEHLLEYLESLLSKSVRLIFPSTSDDYIKLSNMSIHAMLSTAQDILSRPGIPMSKETDDLGKIIRSLIIISIVRVIDKISMSRDEDIIRLISSVIYPGVLSDIGQPENKPSVKYISGLM